MSTPLHRLLAFIALLTALAACSQDRPDGESRMPADGPEAVERPAGVGAQESNPTPGPAAAPSVVPDVPNPRAPASFSCDNGSTVEIADLVAVVTLKDGRTVQIARDPDDAFHFQGEALSFRMKDGQGQLAQDEGGTTRCMGG